MDKNNVWLEYYGKHSISPVKQNIVNMDLHYAKREKLYRQLGMPAIMFKDKNILEVGPGSGYNTLAFFKWGGVNIELVEANSQGISEMKKLFDENNIPKSNYNINECTIENYPFHQEFDIIIAEGFIHALPNSREIINLLSEHTNEGGVVVITCMDEASMLVETIKRLICHFYTREIYDYEDKVKFCTRLFEPQFVGLKGMSRTVEDWVRDDMLNPAFHSETLLGIGDAISMFPPNFHFLGSSQRMFTDYSWYKDLDYDERTEIATQYKEKQHNLILTGIRESILDVDTNILLNKKLQVIKRKCKEYENSYETILVNQILSELEQLLEILKIENKIYEFIKESIDILHQIIEGDESLLMESHHVFYSAVGRTQQYLSMVKDMNY